ncbi:cation:proton antiporter [Cyanobium sp. CH-040]|uniref:cation:proton antiporter n=1 Tax=Cyanobium sp. CH-040 TaxID=2823708 RepID=UPI0020CF730E|nr:cation:proton antiporter [Cyanobium sp. CH-040]MCP9928615.1 cation:proton antiporter [Cyanobium sp. CH-040]
MAVLLISLGSILLLALLATALAERAPLPRVTLLLLLGVISGAPVLALIPAQLVAQFGVIANITLLMVGFLIGGKLSHHSLAHEGRQVVLISLLEAVGTVASVGMGLMLLGLDWAQATVLGCIAAATAPTAVLDVVAQLTGGSGPRRRFADLLLGITALDDVWALLLFGIGLALARASQGQDPSPLLPLLWACRELGGGALVGLAVGLPAALLTGRIREGQPMLLEALGIVLLCGGLAAQFQVSYLVAAMVMGAVIANLARHHDYPFHAIEGIELPFMALFFVLAGASLDVGGLRRIGGVGLAYVLLRCLGKVGGAATGARWAGTDPLTRRWVGAALLPQAGLAVGMALVAADQLGEGAAPVLSLAIGSTVAFELVGAPLVRLALSHFRDTPEAVG